MHNSAAAASCERARRPARAMPPGGSGASAGAPRPAPPWTLSC